MTQAIAGRLLLAAVGDRRADRGRMTSSISAGASCSACACRAGTCRDEVKQQEGDPHVRARLRQIRLERSRKRMMQNVPKSTVVITNPTHYSVALRYDPEKDAAPVCMAKGADEVRAAHPRDRQGAQHPDRRERAAGAGAVRIGRGRGKRAARALRGGGESHRLRHEHREGEEAMSASALLLHRTLRSTAPAGAGRRRATCHGDPEPRTDSDCPA